MFNIWRVKRLFMKFYSGKRLKMPKSDQKFDLKTAQILQTKLCPNYGCVGIKTLDSQAKWADCFTIQTIQNDQIWLKMLDPGSLELENPIESTVLSFHSFCSWSIAFSIAITQETNKNTRVTHFNDISSPATIILKCIWINWAL